MDKMPFSQFRLHTETDDLTSFTSFELMLELSRLGWTYVKKTSSKKEPAYVPGATKQWFYNKSIGKYYLGVLARSELLFGAGLKCIQHFQQDGYYKALSHVTDGNLLNTLKPWQPWSYYKVWMQKAKKGTLKVDAGDSGEQVFSGGMESEDIGGTLIIILESIQYCN